jgi:hypothetical protein
LFGIKRENKKLSTKELEGAEIVVLGPSDGSIAAAEVFCNKGSISLYLRSREREITREM